MGVLAGAAVGVLLGSNPPVAELLLVWLVTAGLVCASRGTLLAARSLSSLREPPLRTLIVGAGNVGQLAARRIAETRALGLQPVGYLDKEPREAVPAIDGAPNLPVLGASWDLEDVIAREGIESVLIAFSTAPHDVMLDIVRRCWTLGVDVQIVPRLWEVEGARSRIEHVGALPLVNLQPADPRSARLEVKYWIDRVIAAIALVALSPLLLAIAAAIRVDRGRTGALSPGADRARREGLRDAQVPHDARRPGQRATPPGPRRCSAWTIPRRPPPTTPTGARRSAGC